MTDARCLEFGPPIELPDAAAVAAANHAFTLDRITRAHVAEDAAAALMRHWHPGRQVVQPEKWFARDKGEALNRRDPGDLFVDGQRIEVKWLTTAFTGLDDWPFREYFVCRAASFDRVDPRPHMVIAFNAAMTHMGIVFGRDRPAWRTRAVLDSNYTTTDTQLILYCDPASVTWRAVPAAVRPDPFPTHLILRGKR